MMFDLIVNAITFPEWISETAIPLPGPLSIKWYGLAYIIGIFGAYYWALRSTRKKDIWIPEGMTRGSELIPNKLLLEDFAFFCMLGIIVGGRLGSVILYGAPPGSPSYLEAPLNILKVWEGGMAFHGGFAGVCLAVLYITRKHKISLWRWADLAAIGAPLGILAVRLANFVNQELVGRATDVPWAFIFPKTGDWTPRHPSQLYEAALEGFAIFFILYLLSRKKKVLTKPGICAGLFFLLYGSFRIFVEFFREPDAALFGPFTRGMSYSIPMIIIGLCIVVWAARRPPVAPKHMPPAEKKSKKD